jgi:hypothetical protein
MANHEPGIRLVNAAHCHQARPWGERVRINSGVVVEEGRVLPRCDWRAPSPAEIALLTAGDGGPEETLALFNIPQRLHDQWWSLEADQDRDAETKRAAFQEYAGELLAYLQFKQLPLPTKCTVSALVHAVDLASTKPNAGGLTAAPACPATLGGINLSDEEAALVFLNLGATHLAARIPAPTSFPERALAFLTACSDYPVVRVALQPGEGFWLPPSPVAYDGDTRGRTEIDVQLVLHRE